MKTTGIPCFCKVNLWLEILGRRPDGYHELLTVFQTLDLCDYLQLETGSHRGVRLSVEGIPVPANEENLVFRAAELFLARCPTRTGLTLHLSKRIPVGAGLGGGSSDAAVTLLALNARFGFPLTREVLRDLAATLGSDVVFFLEGGTAVGTGRGTAVSPIADADLPGPLLIVWPGFGVSTRLAYGLLEARPWLPDSRLTSADPDTTIRQFLGIVKERNWGALRNDLEEPVLRNYPALAALKRDLIDMGCTGVLLTGSGSALFALGSDSVLARSATLLRNRGLEKVFLCRPVARGDYKARLNLDSLFRTGSV